MSAQEGNRYLREMGSGLAASKCKLELRDNPEWKAAYDRWCEDNREQIKSMDSEFRAIGPFIAGRKFVRS